MTRSPRFWLLLGVAAYVLNFLLVARADAFITLWQIADFFSWMR